MCYSGLLHSSCSSSSSFQFALSLLITCANWDGDSRRSGEITVCSGWGLLSELWRREGLMMNKTRVSQCAHSMHRHSATDSTAKWHITEPATTCWIIAITAVDVGCCCCCSINKSTTRICFSLASSNYYNSKKAQGQTLSQWATERFLQQ